MNDTLKWFHQESTRTLKRMLPRLEAILANSITTNPSGWEQFSCRLEERFTALFQQYYSLYGNHYDFFFYLEELLIRMAYAWFKRPEDLRELDKTREDNPTWFQSNQMLGGVCYVDLFADNLENLRTKIPYFQELGLTYLHLMPIFKKPNGPSDGGYAISSYREIYPPLGNMAQLATLARDLRQAGISLSLDLVFNHTSNEHTWALSALAGDSDHQAYYRMYPDRALPDQYEQNLREIFPDEHPGAFTYSPEIGKWIWTTFHSYQWDLNYENPAVFNEIAETMLFLANQGVEVLRLDAVAFTWKQLGTSCENLPKAHTLIQVLNTTARIAAPALLFKSEAIVHPDEVIKYISPDECQLSYNPLLMALLWNSLATRKVQLLSQALATRFQLPAGCAWVNYVRSHDDIGWTFSDEDAAALGINSYDHRQFLNNFYTGTFPGSFARGLQFQSNPKTGDARISGTCASLAGLEKAILEEGSEEVELAIRRILLIHGVVLTAGGIPLIYLGDEIGTRNDYGYRDDPAHSHDSRWVHRPRADWEHYSRRNDTNSVEGRVFQGLKRLIILRKSQSVFSGNELIVIYTGNDHLLGFIRKRGKERAVIIANFSESEQTIPASLLSTFKITNSATRLHGDAYFTSEKDLILPSFDFCVLKNDRNAPLSNTSEHP
jgi:glycosidase